jgi:hypothetical protein
MALTTIGLRTSFVAPWKGVLMASMRDHGPTALRQGLRAAGEEQARRRDDFPSRLAVPTYPNAVVVSCEWRKDVIAEHPPPHKPQPVDEIATVDKLLSVSVSQRLADSTRQPVRCSDETRKDAQ